LPWLVTHIEDLRRPLRPGLGRARFAEVNAKAGEYPLMCAEEYEAKVAS
jgi:hypothetical protein